MQQVEAGLVGCVPGSFYFHAAEGPYGNMTVRLATPGATPVLYARQLSRCFVNEQVDRILIAEPVSAGDGIVKMIIETVVALDYSGGAALGGNGVAAHRIDLGDQCDLQGWRSLGDRDRGAQAGTAGADNCNGFAPRDTGRYISIYRVLLCKTATARHRPFLHPT